MVCFCYGLAQPCRSVSNGRKQKSKNAQIVWQIVNVMVYEITKNVYVIVIDNERLNVNKSDYKT